MTDDPRRPVPGDPLAGGEDEGRPGEAERDAFGNPIAPGGAQPPPPAGPAYGPGGGFAPPAQPAAPGHPPPPPPGAAPPVPPGYGTAPSAPPGYLPAPQPVVPAVFGAHTLASWGQRVGAAGINFILRLLALVPAIVAFAVNLEALGVTLLVAGLVWIYLLYAPLFMMRAGEHNGQTPGKQVVGIRVVRESGEPITFGWALLREAAVKNLLMETIGGFLLLPTVINYLWPLWDEQNRALHDMVASTRVVDA